MTTKKSLTELTNEVLNSRMSAAKKAQALVKLGVTPYEAMVLARTFIPTTTPRTPRVAFSYTFGVEMETVNCDRTDFMSTARANGLQVFNQVFYNHNDMNLFKLVPDSSLSGHMPAECVSPALNSNARGFGSLKACCKTLRDIHATVNRTCGLHVHIGAKDLSEQEYCNVFLNYKMMETAIDSFMAPSRRESNSRWCRSLNGYSLENCHTRESVLRTLCGDRYHKVNPCSWGRHKTIEFRQHAGTINYKKVEAWVKFLGKLVGWSKSNRLTESITRIEDIPFLTQQEKNYFCGRRAALQGC